MRQTLILAMACTVLSGMTMASLAAEQGRVDTKTETKAPETKAPLAPAEIKGEVLKIDGDSFVVNDERSKKEVKFTIEKDVKATLDRPLKQGDRIEAYLTPEGLAKKVRFEGAKDNDMMHRSGKDLGDIQSPGGFSKEIPSGGQGAPLDQGGMKNPEGSNPTLSPSGKGSASGG